MSFSQLLVARGELCLTPSGSLLSLPSYIGECKPEREVNDVAYSFSTVEILDEYETNN